MGVRGSVFQYIKRKPVITSREIIATAAFLFVVKYVKIDITN